MYPLTLPGPIDDAQSVGVQFAGCARPSWPLCAAIGVDPAGGENWPPALPQPHNTTTVNKKILAGL